MCEKPWLIITSKACHKIGEILSLLLIGEWDFKDLLSSEKHSYIPLFTFLK